MAQYEFPTASDGIAISIIVEDDSTGWATLDVGGQNGSFPLPKANGGLLELRVIVDASVVEAFAGGGRAVVTRRFYRGTDEQSVSVFNEGTASVDVGALAAFELKKPTVPSRAELRRVASQSK